MREPNLKAFFRSRLWRGCRKIGREEPEGVGETDLLLVDRCIYSRI